MEEAVRPQEQKPDLKPWLALALKAAEDACRAVLQVYESGDFDTEMKGDASPLTRADKNAHQKIVSVLEGTGLPILSEEGKSIPFSERKQWKYFWMVDPLDGTKEFIKRNGEFTVNIALIDGSVPVLGVVAVPVTGTVYYASEGNGAWLWKDGVKSRLEKRERADLGREGLRVVASRSHLNAETEAFIRQLRNPSLLAAGSSLKFMLVANGEADVYPRYAPTMEWDTAAAHAIVKETGREVRQAHAADPLRYNKEDLLNPHFLVT